MLSQHVVPSSSNVMGGSRVGGLQLSCTSSTAITDQFGGMQVAIQLSSPSTGQGPSISMDQNSTAFPAWQGSCYWHHLSIKLKQNHVNLIYHHIKSLILFVL